MFSSMAIKIKKAPKFSSSFKNYDGGFYQDEKCCSNKTSMDTDHGFAIIYFLKISAPQAFESIFHKESFA